MEERAKRFITNKTRLAWRYYSENRKRCLATRKCITCGRKGKVFADHIEPVVDPEKGFVDWNTYMSRMFDGALQPLCRTDHDAKTKKENAIRKEIRARKKQHG